MLSLIAHAGEHHETAAEAAAHDVLGIWYIALPLFVLAMVGIATITYFLSRKSKVITMNVVLVLLLVAGAASYSFSPPVSILALSLGFGLVLFQVVLSLKHGDI